jgi:hypothetical protein
VPSPPLRLTSMRRPACPFNAFFASSSPSYYCGRTAQ